MAQTVSYPRVPCEKFQNLLVEGGFLAPLRALNGREFKGVNLDVHFRINNEIQVYCGLTRVLTVRMLQRPAGSLKIDADGRYTRQPRVGDTGLFRQWSDGEQGLGEAIEAYLDVVEVNSSFTEGEGAVQSRWSRVNAPWVPFDREAVLEYESAEHREKSRVFPKVEAAMESIREVAARDVVRSRPWKELEPRARKVDQLAVDPGGRLVLIELKHAGANDAGVYYAPFQLLQYLWEWHCALEAVFPDLQALLKARKLVLPMGNDVAQLKGGIRAAVGFGPDTWSAEVARRYHMVLEIANQHLPPAVAPMETWKHGPDGPCQISKQGS